MSLPVPFIVGVGRSGTTLLRLLLDAHTDLAIPPEANWLTSTLEHIEKQPFDLETCFSAFLAAPSWADYAISEQDLRNILQSHDVNNPGQTLTSIYSLYAGRHGKPRFGDKTPKNVLRIERLAKLIPEAHFVHIIRDGRDVAVSWRNVWFGQGLDIEELAKMWKSQIIDARTQSKHANYIELRYEELVANPRIELEKLAVFLQLPFQLGQLEAHLNAKNRLSEFKDMPHVSAKTRLETFTLVHQPPMTSQVNRWKTELSLEAIERFEIIAGDFLAELGYSA
jgi:Sulfotransferase family